MPNPRPFDGYLEQPVRVSSDLLVHFQRSRYSVPAGYAHQVVSLRIYPGELVMVADNVEIARHALLRAPRTFYDFRPLHRPS